MLLFCQVTPILQQPYETKWSPLASLHRSCKLKDMASFLESIYPMLSLLPFLLFSTVPSALVFYSKSCLHSLDF